MLAALEADQGEGRVFLTLGSILDDLEKDLCGSSLDLRREARSLLEAAKERQRKKELLLRDEYSKWIAGRIEGLKQIDASKARRNMCVVCYRPAFSEYERKHMDMDNVRTDAKGLHACDKHERLFYRPTALWQAIYNRSSKNKPLGTIKSVVVDLKRREVWQLMLVGECQHCRAALSTSEVLRLVRKDPSQPYVLANVLRVCATCERMYRTVHGAWKQLLWQAQVRNIAVELTAEDLVELMKVRQCHYCGHTVAVDGYPRLDRRSSDGPYSLDNVVRSCWECNISKNRMSYEEWFAYCHLTERQQRRVKYCTKCLQWKRRREFSNTKGTAGRCTECADRQYRERSAIKAAA